MPTSNDIDLHYLAKKAKSRLSNHNDGKTQESNKYIKKANEDYFKVIRMIAEEETVYNPVARLVGKDLHNIPDSSEKQFAVFQTIQTMVQMRNKFKRELTKASRAHVPFVLDGKEYNPDDLLSKLH